MKRILLLSMVFSFVCVLSIWAQRTVSGRVTDDKGEGLPGVNVVIKGTTTGVTTDLDGNFQISILDESTVLVFSSVGMSRQELLVGAQTTMTVTMVADVTQLQEVVVTALGMERSQASLGYSVQQVGNDAVGKAKEASFISSLSGKFAGVQVSKSNQLGGSINILVRGSSSLTKNNQALFVVDGILISNSNINSSAQQAGGGGYDYGNAASDIDPESIESISVLKGAAAAALYGSDAANGVILITTKKGTKGKGIGVTISHSTSFSKYDKSTFPEYQNQYGAGYGPYYSDGEYPGLIVDDFDGDGTDDLVVPSGEDASFGQKFDEDLMVFQWNSFYPQLDTYLQKTPWIAGKNGPETIFQTGVANVTSLSFEGGNESGTFRLGITNDDRTGILPNSHINRNIIDLSTSHNLTDKLNVSGKITYTKNEAEGRYGTGYDSRNVMQSFRQWFEVNVDLKEQEEAYRLTKQNITWNTIDQYDLDPHYFDNPYFQLYENYQNDERNRMFGTFQTSYELTDWLSVMTRLGIDMYSDLQEERIAIGSLDQSQYSKFNRNFRQNSVDFILNVKKQLTSKLDFSALLGVSRINEEINSTRATTNGGLVIPRFYSLSNSFSSPNPAVEFESTKRKYRYYGQFTFGFNNMLYLDQTITREASSTLPEGDNVYNYYSTAVSFLFTEIIDISFMDFGKVRGSYAKVGNDAGVYSVNNTFIANPSFGSKPVYSVGDVSLNPNLTPEFTTEVEIGIETAFLTNRAGLQLTYYKRNTTDQIFNVQVPVSTGYNSKWVNSGEIQNAGVEVVIYGSPVKSGDFEWRVTANWAKNKNEVISLADGITNLLLYSQWSTGINARVGEGYGTITGTNYVYTDGKKTVGTDGKYLRTESSTEVIGNLQPDWTGGIQNSLSYKSLSFGFLIDIQKGGDILNYDWAFGNATGIYATTAGNNNLGNPQRDPVAEGGGILLPGVKADGTKNDIYAEADTYEHPFGYYGGSYDVDGAAPDAQNIFDASYVKLREVTIDYVLPAALVAKSPFKTASIGAYGRNLWIIHKNLPYGDPEYNTSSGNIRGIQNAAHPATKEFGFNVRVQF